MGNQGMSITVSSDSVVDRRYCLRQFGLKWGVAGCHLPMLVACTDRSTWRFVPDCVARKAAP